MTDVASALPSAGWYADPADAERLRWWDGLGWSQNSMPAPVATPQPTAPPMSHTPTVDEHRHAESPRRAARAPRPERGDDDLAPVTQLRPLPTPAAHDLIATNFDAAPAVAASLSRPAAPQPVVPPVTVPQDATPVEPTIEHLPQLGLVPNEVFAPEPVAVVVAPVASEFAPTPSGVVAAAPAPAAPAPAAPMPTIAQGAVPAPGEFVGGPLTVDAVNVHGAATVAAPAFAPVPAAAPAPVAPSAPLAPAGLPASPAAFGQPVATATTPAGLPDTPSAFAEPAAQRQPERRTVVQDDSWWVGLVPSTAQTPAAWLLAFAPLFSIATLLASVAVVVWMPQFTIALTAVGLISILLPFVLAAADRRRLLALGWLRPASAALTLLGPFWYLVGRQVQLRKQGAPVNPLLAVTISVGLLTPIGVYGAAMVFAEQLRVLALILELRA